MWLDQNDTNYPIDSEAADTVCSKKKPSTLINAEGGLIKEEKGYKVLPVNVTGHPFDLSIAGKDESMSWGYPVTVTYPLIRLP